MAFNTDGSKLTIFLFFFVARTSCDHPNKEHRISFTVALGNATFKVSALQILRSGPPSHLPKRGRGLGFRVWRRRRPVFRYRHLAHTVHRALRRRRRRRPVLRGGLWRRRDRGHRRHVYTGGGFHGRVLQPAPGYTGGPGATPAALGRSLWRRACRPDPSRRRRCTLGVETVAVGTASLV